MVRKKVSDSARRLKELRQEAGVSMDYMAQHLGMPGASSYAHYEERYKRPFLPVDLARRIATILSQHGVPEAKVLELAGVTQEMPRTISVARRINEARVKAGLSIERLAGLVNTTQVRIKEIESGRTVPSQSELDSLSRALHSNLALSETPESRNVIVRVPLRGFVGAGERVVMLPDDVVEWIDAPPCEDREVEALEIRGDSMMPAYRNGDVVYFEKGRTNDVPSLVDQECIVELDSGEVYVKRLAWGTKPNHYTLLSYSGQPIKDCRVKSAAPVLWVKKGRKR